jgi:hypothetical protein
MRNHPSTKIKISFFLILAFSLCATVIQAAEVTLAWDPHDNPHNDLIGYNLYYKADSSVQADPDGATLIYIPLTESGFDPDNPSYQITGLLDDTQYYFTLTAMVGDEESGMSNEVSAINGASSMDTNAGTSSTGSGVGGGCFISSLK